MSKVTGLRVCDIRFPTSQYLDGSDAMNPSPDYSAAYVILETDINIEGHGLTFTIGRGNEICVTAIDSLSSLIVEVDLDWIAEDLGRFWRHMTSESQLRWVGPEKGVIHLATSAIVNAVWDILAKRAKKPLWQFVAEMSPEEIIKIVDFRYLTDAIKPEEALELLQNSIKDKRQRVQYLQAQGYPCYTTSTGWLGYTDDKVKRLCQEAKTQGFTHAKFKVGKNLQDDIRRLTIAREALGNEIEIMIDANQVWEVDEAIQWIHALRFANPYFVEEPTSPDDILGHKKIRDNVLPIKIATGEMCHNRIMFKQFMAAQAIDIVQLDSCRLGGLNEAIAVLLLAAKYDLPVWPHAGGVGLCEYVQHVSMIDYVAVSGKISDRRIEYVNHLHEHFIDPCIIVGGAYMAPKQAGFSIEMKQQSIEQFAFTSM